MPAIYLCYNVHKSYLCNEINTVISASEQHSHLFYYKNQKIWILNLTISYLWCFLLPIENTHLFY